MKKVIIIGQHHSLIRDFARTALGLTDESSYWPLSLEGGGNDDVFRAVDPKEINVYYLWTRPTPLFESGARILEIAKTLGFRPICVVDW